MAGRHRRTVRQGARPAPRPSGSTLRARQRSPATGHRTGRLHVGHGCSGPVHTRARRQHQRRRRTRVPGRAGRRGGRPRFQCHLRDVHVHLWRAAAGQPRQSDDYRPRRRLRRSAGGRPRRRQAPAAVPLRPCHRDADALPRPLHLLASRIEVERDAPPHTLSTYRWETVPTTSVTPDFFDPTTLRLGRADPQSSLDQPSLGYTLYWLGAAFSGGSGGATARPLVREPLQPRRPALGRRSGHPRIHPPRRPLRPVRPVRLTEYTRTTWDTLPPLSHGPYDHCWSEEQVALPAGSAQHLLRLQLAGQRPARPG